MLFANRQGYCKVKSNLQAKQIVQVPNIKFLYILCVTEIESCIINHYILFSLFAIQLCYVCACITVYPKKYAHGFCFAVLCCGYTLTDFPISIRLTSLALWQSNDCPSASKATLLNMDKYFMWIHYERLHNHNKAKHNKTVCIFLGIYCISVSLLILYWNKIFELSNYYRWCLQFLCYHVSYYLVSDAFAIIFVVKGRWIWLIAALVTLIIQ